MTALGRGWRWAAASASVVLLVLCGSIIFDRSQRTHDRSHGPLRLDPAGGSSSIYAPRHRDQWNKQWDATFGATFLCRDDPEDDITLQQVRVVKGFNAENTRAVVRTLSDSTAQRMVSQEQMTKNEYIVSMDGSILAGSWRKWPGDRFSGNFHTPVQGQHITRSCSQGFDNEEGFQELLLILGAEEAGSAVSELEIDYEVNGKPRTVSTATGDWSIVACGDAVQSWLDANDPIMTDACQGRRMAGE